MSAVVLKNICKIYDGGVKAVDNVNIDIDRSRRTFRMWKVNNPQNGCRP